MKNLFLLFALLFFAHETFAKNVENEYLVKYRGVNSNVIGIKSLGLDSFPIKSFFIGKKDANIIKSFDEMGIMHVFLSQEEKADLLAKKKNTIEYLEANRVIKAYEDKVVPAIPETQWGLDTIDVLDGWAKTIGSPEIVVGVIDSGVDYYHYALKNSMWTNPEDGGHGWDFIDDTNLPYDENSHGTHCAGVIAANSKNLMGVAPNVKIMALRFLDKDGSGATDGAIGAIYYGVKHGAKILSNSWGGGGYQKSLYDAISFANANNVLFVAAAGNEYNNNDRKSSYPASYKLDNVISVGAMDKNIKKASFSNYGKKSVHLFGPGVDIYSTVPNGKAAYMSGTSMATPFVAGGAALLYSLNPNLAPIEVKNLMIKEAKKHLNLMSYCKSGGYLDLEKLLD